MTTAPTTLIGLLLLLLVGGLGFPIPEDATLVASGMLAHTGAAPLAAVVAVGIVGVCAADWTMFLLGRRYGAGLAAHPRVARLVRREHLAAIEALVRRRGGWAVLLARFVLGTRMATFLSAGTFGMRPAVFALADTTGSTLFVTAAVTLGYTFALHAERLLADLGRAEHWLVATGLLAAIGWVVGRPLAARSAPAPRDE